MSDIQGFDPGRFNDDPTGNASRLNAMLRKVKTLVAGAVDLILTTRGDLLTRSASTLTRLAVGAANTVLRSDGTDPSWGKIVNADITDDTIAVGKLADGTAGQLITWDAAGEATTVATGTATHVLTSNGAGAAPTFQVPAIGDINGLTTTDNPPSSAYVAGSTGAATNRKFRVGEVGGWCALEEQTASASASLNFVLTGYTADFEDFEFIIHHLLPADDGVDLWIRTSSNGGSSYDSGASDYRWAAFSRTDANAIASNQDTADSEIGLTGTTVGNAAGEGCSGRITLINPAAAANARLVGLLYMFSTAGVGECDVVSGTRLSAADVDAIQFLFSTGNIASGKITLMGRRKVT